MAPVPFKADRADGLPRKARVTVRLTQDGYDQLALIAESLGVPIGEIVRQGLSAAASMRIGPFRAVTANEKPRRVG